MDVPPPLPPAERLARLIAALVKAVAARGGRDANRIELPHMILPGPLTLLIWRPLHGVAVRFAAIAARIQAGTFRTRQASHRPPASPPPPDRPKRTPPPPQPPYLRRPGWLNRLVPEARFGAGQLQTLLAEPDMAALLAQSQQLRRIIHPLCRMLNVPPPPLRPASPKPPPQPAPAPPPAPAKTRAAPHAAPSRFIIAEVPQRWRLQPLPARTRRPGGRGPPVPA